MPVGLVMEGGSMRGLFTAGILDVWMEQGIGEFTAAIGVSAGACFGCNYKSHQPGRALRYNLKYCADPRYHSLRSLLTSGDLYNADFCYRRIPYELDPMDFAAYRADPMEFWADATDADTGETVYRRLDTCDGEDLQFVRASASLPIVSRAVEINGRRLLDGGMTDGMPLKWMTETRGIPRSVVILTRPAGYRKKPYGHDRLFRLILRKYPAAAECLRLRHQRYNETLDYIADREKAGQALVLRPPKALELKSAETSPERLQAAYDMGRQVGLETAEKVRAFVAQG